MEPWRKGEQKMRSMTRGMLERMRKRAGVVEAWTGVRVKC